MTPASAPRKRRSAQRLVLLTASAASAAGQKELQKTCSRQALHECYVGSVPVHWRLLSTLLLLLPRLICKHVCLYRLAQLLGAHVGKACAVVWQLHGAACWGPSNPWVVLCKYTLDTLRICWYQMPSHRRERSRAACITVHPQATNHPNPPLYSSQRRLQNSRLTTGR